MTLTTNNIFQQSSNIISSMPQTKRVVFVNDSFDRENSVREINANFSVPVTVETKILNWQVLSGAGIKQQCLERLSGNKSRLSSLAQFPAGRAFKKFGHKGGEELLVLSGIFSDADGDYGAGCYVRNPPGTYHQPFTRDGCTVLFKLGQFQPMDRKRLVINTRGTASKWQHAGEPGVSRQELHHFAEEEVSLHRIHPECWVTFKLQSQGLEVFVCEGPVSESGNLYSAGSWMRYPAGSKVKISSKGGACLYVKKSIFPL